MARTKTTPEGFTRVTVVVSETIAKKATLASGLLGQSLDSVVEKALTEYVNESIKAIIANLGAQ